jgi:hypothetical protein
VGKKKTPLLKMRYIIFGDHSFSKNKNVRDEVYGAAMFSPISALKTP